MKMKTISKSLLLFALVVVTMFSSCRNDETSSTTDVLVPTPEKTYETFIHGRVVNQLDEAISNAQVYFDGKIAFSDEFGVFKVNGLADINHVNLQVKAPGYFNGVKVLTVAQGDVNQTKITLIDKGDANQIKSEEGGLVETDNITIDFAANSFVDNNGNAYSGGINVYTTYFDPSQADMYQTMPGNLSAISNDQEISSLQSFGMIGVQLESTSGEELQINKPAEINVKVPATLLSTAPSTIPLWHMDEESGYWMEEGSAELIGNTYVGTVNHFSFWNCDIPIAAITLRGTVTTTIRGLSSPVSGVSIHVTQISTGSKGTAITSDNGTYGGFVPANELLLLEIFDACGELVYSQEVGPFSTDEVFDFDHDFGTEMITLSGLVNACDGSLLDDASILVYSPSNILLSQFPVNPDGTYLGSLLKCDFQELEVYAYDRTTNERSDRLTIDATTSSVSLPNISTCAQNVDSEFIRITYPDQSILEYNMISSGETDSLGVEIYEVKYQVGTGSDFVIVTQQFANWESGAGGQWSWASFHEITGNASDPSFEFWILDGGDPSGTNVFTPIELGGLGEIVKIKVEDTSVRNPNTGEVLPVDMIEYQFYR